MNNYKNEFYINHYFDKTIIKLYKEKTKLLFNIKFQKFESKIIVFNIMSL